MSSPETIIITRDKNHNIFTSPNREHSYYDMSFSYVGQEVEVTQREVEFGSF